MKSYDYEEDLDILYIYNDNHDKEKVFSNLVFGNIVIDIGKEGNVLGIEIDCPSKLLRFPSEQLKNLKTAKILVTKIDNFLTLTIVIATEIKEHSFQFAVIEESKNKIPIVSY